MVDCQSAIQLGRAEHGAAYERLLAQLEGGCGGATLGGGGITASAGGAASATLRSACSRRRSSSAILRRYFSSRSLRTSSRSLRFWAFFAALPLRSVQAFFALCFALGS